ncbi:hypothetical protein [Pseudomonas sp. CFBP 13719]|uniref:hypothetical protein n=1 Tax=Pseudomonas sp. CFBP 13719 TaxID=2775303 RepID=UPI00177E5287|nr:hypothetical protein [Pseudomonas sp. CFBP 13719]MBD8682269.1 hypothetical protein [Pseudomonas sp. CFBP 13719]
MSSQISVGAVIGREGLGAVCLVDRGVGFAATDRSYMSSQLFVGAVIGREGLYAGRARSHIERVRAGA